MPTLFSPPLQSSLKRTAVLAMLAAAAVTFAAPAQAEANHRVVIERSNLKGVAVFADWSYQEGNTLFYIALVASSTKSRTKADGRQQFDVASLSITRSNVETGNVEISGAAYTEVFDLDVNSNQSKARFRADAIFQDDNSFTFFDVHVDLTLHATAPAVILHDHNIDRETPGLIIRTRFDGKFRAAVATGSVLATPRTDSDSAIDVPTEFTPIPSSNGEIQKNKFGSITVQVNNNH